MGSCYFSFSCVLRLITSASQPFVPSQHITNSICMRIPGSTDTVLRLEVLVQRAWSPTPPHPIPHHSHLPTLHLPLKLTMAEEINFLGAPITHS